ncbi:MAG: holin, BlyA family protein [Lachnospiraceae bacterium]|nr:holin, BlyA family protein [Lachnospiraceae bacterium]
MGIREFLREEDAIGTVEVVLLLVIIVSLVIIFRTTIKEIVEDTLENVKTKSDSVDNFGD